MNIRRLVTAGRPGSGDGWAGGVQLGHQLTPFGLPAFSLIDNQLPASS